MPVDVLVGCHWGDEGKGRYVDLLSERADIVTRFQGGPNAGHTLVVDGEQTILHMVPSGVLRPNVTNVLGNGVVFSPSQFAEEVSMLAKKGIYLTPNNMKVSDRAHIILQSWIDEDLKGSHEKIGTTGKGIGPTYLHKFRRDGIRVGDLFGRFENKPDGISKAREELSGLLKLLEPFVCDTVSYLNRSLDAGLYVVGEGAQGAGLDVDHGTYPNCTSSSPTAGGFCTGTGIGPKRIRDVYGVVKAYTTRVGNGTFPTELFDEVGAFLATRGGEVGATTGRDRRCGWLDLDLTRRAYMINSVTKGCLTKLDVLSGLNEIKVFVHGNYVSFPGWSDDITDVREFGDLPENAQEYVRNIEGVLGVPFAYVSVGAERSAIISR